MAVWGGACERWGFVKWIYVGLITKETKRTMAVCGEGCLVGGFVGLITLESSSAIAVEGGV